jgi:hypothetical protein
MTTPSFRTAVLAATILFVPSFTDAAHADATSALRCQQTINKELAKFVKTKSSILKSCKEGAVKRGEPALPVNCPLTAQDDKINAAEQKLKDKIAASCGGANKVCNAVDVGADADEPLTAIGWNIGACPDLHGQGCTNAITDCNDIGACAACIGHEAVNQSNELAYDLLEPTEFASGSPVNKCQIAIGKATTSFLQTKSKLLKGCWANVLAAKTGFTAPPGCPATDAKTLTKLAQAEQKKIAAICKACGGGGDADQDGQCDLPGDSFSPTAIGFEPDCPSRVVPSTGQPCSAVISDLGALIACVDCVTEFATDCAADVAVPGQTAYPAECN